MSDIEHLRRDFSDRVMSGRERMNAVMCQRCGRPTWAHQPVDIDRIVCDAAERLRYAIDQRVADEVFAAFSGSQWPAMGARIENA